MSGSGIPKPSQSLSARRPPFPLRERYSSCSVERNAAKSDAPSAPEDKKKAEPLRIHLIPNNVASRCKAGRNDMSTRERTCHGRREYYVEGKCERVEAELMFFTS